jgi:hypothetical protein
MLSRAVSESTKNDSSSPENDFDKFLNDKIKKFRTSPVGGSGRGVVSVYPILDDKSEPALVTATRKMMQLAGLLPPLMKDEPFLAAVSHDSSSTLTAPCQRWSRGFASTNPAANHFYFYSSTQFLRLNSSNNNESNSRLFALEESLPGFLGQFVRFQFDVSILESGVSVYKFSSTSILPFGKAFPSFRIPLPKFLAPATEWKETQMKNGWKFEGVIKMPQFLYGVGICGYGGEFHIDESKKESNFNKQQQQQPHEEEEQTSTKSHCDGRNWSCWEIFAAIVAVASIILQQ